MSDCPYFDASHSMLLTVWLTFIMFVKQGIINGRLVPRILIVIPALRMNTFVAGIIRREKELKRQKNRRILPLEGYSSR